MGDHADADAAIRSLLARIAQLADSGDLDEYISQFTDDAVWAMPANPLMGMEASTRRGHEEILAGVRERRGRGSAGPGHRTPATSSRPPRSRSRATGTQRRGRTTSSSVDTTTTPTLRTMGQYDDVFVRHDRGWQLAHRTITLG